MPAAASRLASPGRTTLSARLIRLWRAYAETRSRRARIVALSALSDAQLAHLGLRRDLIARHVFRDLI